MKRNKLLLIAAIVGSLYAVYLCTYFSNRLDSDGLEAIAAGIATVLVMPHMVCTVIAVIFNWIGWASNAGWAALVAGILYAVAMVCTFLYAIFVLVEMILCFVAYAKMRKRINE